MPIESSISFGDNLRNHLLIATPSLKDPHFSHTVTYICDHSQEGAMGIVLNRPLDLNIGQVFEELNLPWGAHLPGPSALRRPGEYQRALCCTMKKANGTPASRLPTAFA